MHVCKHAIGAVILLFHVLDHLVFPAVHSEEVLSPSAASLLQSMGPGGAAQGTNRDAKAASGST